MFVEKALLQASLWGISAIFAAPVFAAHAIPVNTTFTATGPTTMTQSLITINCISTFTLVSDDGGNVKVTQATFAGGSGLCRSLSAADSLPWPVSFNSTSAAVINNVLVKSPLGTCSGSVDVSIDNANSLISLKGPLGPCTVSGGLSVVPQFRVVD
jgi:hypothetical protein